MIYRLPLLLLLFFISSFSSGQSIGSLMLAPSEVPDGYTKLTDLRAATPHASAFYSESGLYESFLGKVTNKSYESYSKKGDEGAILYFEFEKDFTGQAFLNGLLWGDGSRPTKEEPDEYFVKGKLLIIWSFNRRSKLKVLSREKIMRLLAQ